MIVLYDTPWSPLPAWFVQIAAMKGPFSAKAAERSNPGRSPSFVCSITTQRTIGGPRVAAGVLPWEDTPV